jgi:hypothetical protein
MIAWYASIAIAGPLGPFDGGTSDTGLAPAVDCAATWPYALTELPDLPALYRRSDPSRTFGNEVLVEVLVEATARVAAAWPEADPVLVGDLSLRQGGAFPPHKMHDAGRSADLGLFVRDGAQPPPGGFLPVSPDELDLPRTWTLIESLLATGRVRFLLLDQVHIDRLAAWLRAEGWLDEDEIAAVFPDPSTPGLWAYEGIVRHAPDHRDHVHVELNCD